MSEDSDAKGWTLISFGVSAARAAVTFDRFSDCFPGFDSPLQVRPGDTYNEQPPT